MDRISLRGYLGELCGKLEMAAEARPMHADPATAHMFIVNPLRRQAFAILSTTRANMYIPT